MMEIQGVYQYSDVSKIEEHNGVYDLYKATLNNLDVEVCIERIGVSVLSYNDIDEISQKLCAIKHQNLPKVYEVIKSDSFIYLVTDYSPNAITLRDYIKSNRYNNSNVLEWLKQISETI